MKKIAYVHNSTQAIRTGQLILICRSNYSFLLIGTYLRFDCFLLPFWREDSQNSQDRWCLVSRLLHLWHQDSLPMYYQPEIGMGSGEPISQLGTIWTLTCLPKIWIRSLSKHMMPPCVHKRGQQGAWSLYSIYGDIQFLPSELWHWWLLMESTNNSTIHNCGTTQWNQLSRSVNTKITIQNIHCRSSSSDRLCLLASSSSTTCYCLNSLTVWNVSSSDIMCGGYTHTIESIYVVHLCRCV